MHRGILQFMVVFPVLVTLGIGGYAAGVMISVVCQLPEHEHSMATIGGTMITTLVLQFPIRFLRVLVDDRFKSMVDPPFTWSLASMCGTFVFMKGTCVLYQYVIMGEVSWRMEDSSFLGMMCLVIASLFVYGDVTEEKRGRRKPPPNPFEQE